MSDLVRFKGGRELAAFLDQLPEKLQRNVMAGALRAGAKPIAQAIRQSSPIASGQLRAGVKVVSKRGKDGKVIVAVSTQGKHGHIAHWIEYGTASYYVGPGKSVGGAYKIAAGENHYLFFGGNFVKQIVHPGIRPHPFVRPAFDSQASAAILAAANYIKARLATKHGIDTASVDVEITSD